MSEWGVVGVLAALAALGATLLTSMLRLNGTMTRLAVLVEQLADRLDDSYQIILIGLSKRKMKTLHPKIHEQAWKQKAQLAHQACSRLHFPQR